MKKSFIFLSLLFFISLITSPVFSILPTHMSDGDGKVLQSVTAYSYMQVTGKDLITISKEVDSSSPLLYQYMEGGSIISTLNIKFTRSVNSGQDEHYFTITLEDAKIESYSNNFPLTFIVNNSVYKHMEDINISYDKITFKDVVSGTSTSGDSVVQSKGLLQNIMNSIKETFS